MMAKKAGETNNFIADEAKRCMLVATQCCSEARVISALIHANANKNPTIRSKVCMYVCMYLYTR